MSKMNMMSRNEMMSKKVMRAKKTIMGKKGTLLNYVLYWLGFKLPFTIAVLLGVVLIISYGYNISLPSRELDANIINGNMLYSDLIMNNDPITGRVYYGNVDVSRFYSIPSQQQNEELLNAYDLIVQKGITLSENMEQLPLQLGDEKIFQDNYIASLKNDLNMIISQLNENEARVIETAVEALDEIANPEILVEKALADTIKVADDVKYIGMNITLVPYGGAFPGPSSIYYDRKTYEEFRTYYEGDFDEGQGGYKEYINGYQVTVGEKRLPGLLVVRTTIPND